VRWSAWLAAVVIAFALAAARCDRDVPLGVYPGSDAAIDAADAGAAD
jgi:hypothetical protein